MTKCEAFTEVPLSPRVREKERNAWENPGFPGERGPDESSALDRGDVAERMALARFIDAEEKRVDGPAPKAPTFSDFFAVVNRREKASWLSPKVRAKSARLCGPAESAPNSERTRFIRISGYPKWIGIWIDSRADFIYLTNNIKYLYKISFKKWVDYVGR